MEVAAPGLIFIFFGIAALVVALLVWSLAIPVWLQWALFSVFSVLSLVLLRRVFKKAFVGKESQSEHVDDDFVGKTGVVTELLRPGLAGRVELNGSTWAARSDEAIEVGAFVRICSKENITLVVRRV